MAELKQWQASKIAMRNRDSRRKVKRYDFLDPMKIFAPIGWKAPESAKRKKKARPV